MSYTHPFKPRRTALAAAVTRACGAPWSVFRPPRPEKSPRPAPSPNHRAPGPRSRTVKKAIVMPQDAKRGDVLLLTDPPRVVTAQEYRQLQAVFSAVAPQDLPRSRPTPSNIAQQQLKILAVMDLDKDGLGRRLGYWANLVKNIKRTDVSSRLVQMEKLGWVLRNAKAKNALWKITPAGRKHLKGQGELL